MANQKRKRQRAAREAKAAAEKAKAKKNPARSKADPSDLPDVPDAPSGAKPIGGESKSAKKEVVSAKPGRRKRTDSAAAASRQEKVRDVRLKKQRNLAFRRFAIIFGAVIAAFIGIGFLLSGDDADSPVVTQPNATYRTFLASQYGTGECLTGGEGPDTFEDAPQLCIEASEPLQAVFETSEGRVVAELNTTEVVGTTNNFVNLANGGYYDGLEVFRTNPLGASVFSGASSNEANGPGPGYTIPDEANGFVYGSGQLVMSRTQEPDSAGSEYFFTVGEEADTLDAQGNFVVFGTITEGLEALQGILDLHVQDPDDITSGRPGETVTIDSVTIEPIPDA